MYSGKDICVFKDGVPALEEVLDLSMLELFAFAFFVLELCMLVLITLLEVVVVGAVFRDKKKGGIILLDLLHLETTES